MYSNNSLSFTITPDVLSFPDIHTDGSQRGAWLEGVCDDVYSTVYKFGCLYQVTRQLFEPLVMQLIHWFTNNKKFESQDTVAVLEAIMVRDYTL